jgi:FkbM family methyltransferase
MALLRALRYARRYRNWLELERERSAGRTPHHVVLRRGEQFRAPDDTNLIRLVQGVYARGNYTPPGFEIRNADVVVDVGANVGTFSVYAAKRTRGRVLAVEPVPGNVSCLEHNLRLNGCRQVEVFPGALGERDGTASLYLHTSGAAHHLFPESQRGAFKDSIEVPLRTLPSLLDERGFERVDTLKLDCEGAEGLILPTLAARWLPRVRRIAMEWHDDISPLDHDGLEALLRDAGYATRLAWDGSDMRGFLYAWRTSGP